MASPRPSSAVEIRLPEWVAARALPPAPASDQACMSLAIDLARETVARGGGGPFGAVVRAEKTGEILSVGINLAMPTGNPVLHAETVAISLAGRALEQPGGVTLFSSCEPCIMCLGALHWANVGRVVWAALRDDAQAIGFIEGAGCEQLRAEMEARGVVFEPGVMRAEGVAVLRTYAAHGGPIYGPKNQP
jgi:tRNA(Arg) A34 adenosine deaminase TadA